MRKIFCDICGEQCTSETPGETVIKLCRESRYIVGGTQDIEVTIKIAGIDTSDDEPELIEDLCEQCMATIIAECITPTDDDDEDVEELDVEEETETEIVTDQEPILVSNPA